MKAFLQNRKKCLTVILFLLQFLVLTYSSMSTFILSSFKELERQAIIENLGACLNLLAHEQQQLLATAGDYAGWDEAYSFVRTGNPDFVKTNLNPAIFGKLRLNLFVYTDAGGRIVYGTSADYRAGAVQPLSPHLKGQFHPASNLVRHLSADSRVMGLLKLPEGIMLVASHPVLTSEYAGPVAGALIIGRFLDEAELRRLGSVLRMDLVLDSAPAPAAADQVTLPTGEPFLVRFPSEDTIAASAFIKDIHGTPAGAITIARTREISSHGRAASNRFFVLTAVIATLFSGILLVFSYRLSQSQAALKKYQEALEEAQRLALLGSWEWDRQTDRLIWSPQTCELLNWDRSRPLPGYREHLALYSEQSRRQLESAFEQCLESGKPYALDLERADQGGATEWVLARGEAIYGGDGQISGLRGTLENITERKQYERELRLIQRELEQRVAERTEELKQMVAALRDSEARYSLAVEGANDGIWDWDIQNGEAYFSPRWKGMLGYAEGDFDASFEAWQGLVHPDDLQLFLGNLSGYLEGKIGQFELEYRLRQKDGSYRWLSTRGACLRDQQGTPYRMAGSHSDISRRKAAEQALGQETARTIGALKALREKEQILLHQSRQAAMGEMIGNIAHQWRQPLNTLGLLVQQAPLLCDLGEVDRDFLVENARKMMEIINHMSKTIDDFRNYFHPNKELVEFRVQDVVARTLSLLEGSFSSKRIRVETVMSGSEPIVLGYPNELSQVLLNILNNARDALVDRKVEDPKITICIGTSDQRPFVSIHDNAGGIPDEIVERIFEPYFTTKGPQYGSGVGLFMSKTIIEKNMSGRLSVRNRDGGAVFLVEL